MSDPLAALPRRYTREVNGVSLAVTGEEHARLVGYDPENPDHRGHHSVRTVSFSRRSEELSIKYYSKQLGFITYRFLESGVGYLLRHGLRVGDVLTHEQLSDLYHSGHLYTEGEGITGPVVLDGVTGTLGAYDFEAEEEHDWFDSDEAVNVVEGDVDEVDPGEDVLTNEQLRQLASHHFVEMMIHLAWFQEDVSTGSALDDGTLVAFHSRQYGQHFNQMKELLTMALERTDFDWPLGELGPQ